MPSTHRTGVTYALVAAALFGVSTPLAKGILASTDPLVLAGLLYCGSGAGLAAVQGMRILFAPRRHPIDWPARAELRWLVAAIVLGGIIAPPLLLYGLATTVASTASLLLNLESALTAVLAWFLFRENFDRRIAAGMAAIVAGGLILSWTPGEAAGWSRGTLFIIAACACWALDNNLTRKLSDRDPMAIAGAKGLIAGAVNLALALYLGRSLPAPGWAGLALAVGFLGYGVSLTLFVLALRHLGTARAGAYFAVAPFFGAMYALAFQHDAFTLRLGIAGTLMALGTWLHVSERHVHAHIHARIDHAHPHTHDEHHRHSHDAAWDGIEPHSHRHVHEPTAHSHRHVPDIHHRHDH